MKKLLIVTDLDASFIDENYQYSEAQEAIDTLKKLGFPLVFNSSKTLVECESLANELELDTPRIAENGGIIAVPKSSEVSSVCTPSDEHDWKDEGHYQTLITGLSRDFILRQAHKARKEHGYDFTGFDDWSPEELSEITGLTNDDAILAKQRHVSEPILWQDSNANWHQFSAQMEAKWIRTLKGGKFIHLMGPSDKADGLKVIKQIYEARYPEVDWITVALGDSDNDSEMLKNADKGILIPHADGPKIEIPESTPNITLAKYPASKGWNNAVLELIASL